MTLKAALKRLVLSSPNPARLGDFYAHVFDYRAAPAGEECRCEAEKYAAELRAREVPHRRVPLSGSAALVVTDPEGREVWFRAGQRGERRRAADVPEIIGASISPRPAPIPARLQHYAVRTPAPQALTPAFDLPTHPAGARGCRRARSGGDSSTHV